jgi:hypothetical protein
MDDSGADRELPLLPNDDHQDVLGYSEEEMRAYGQQCAAAVRAELEAENFSLAAGQCCELVDGLSSDEYGHQYCAMKVRALAAEQALAEAGEDELAAGPKIMRDLVKRAEAAESELAAYKRDALRYRWLRDNTTWRNCTVPSDKALISYVVKRWYHDSAILEAKTLDAAIDSAMAT